MIFDAIQDAVIYSLENTPSVTEQVQSIGYEHPQGADASDSAAFPYITVHDVSQGPFDTKDSDGLRAQFQISIWSRASSTAGADLVANRVANAVYEAFQKFGMIVPGGNVIDVRFVSSPGILRDPDGKTRHKPMTFTVLMDDI